MIYTNPGFIYIILAILLCSVYYGVELANGGLGGTAKSIIASWCICSLFILSIILAIKKARDDGKATAKHVAIMYGILIGSLVSSSCIIYMAD
jgi:hypothetical protein